MAARKLIFRVGHFYDGRDRFISPCEVVVHEGRVHGFVGKDDQSDAAGRLRRFASDADRIDLPNSFMLPGLINSHHHAYSALARGLPVGGPLPDFPAILENIWWRFDRTLDSTAISLSALVTGLDSIHHGCTTIIDHHSSPAAARGSLEEIARAFAKLNLAGILCYETTDRNGPDAFREAVAENLDFCNSARDLPLTRGMFGLHASFTLSDESLRVIARERPADVPVHVHAAEDECDVSDARARGTAGPLTRLAAFGLLDDKSIIVHGVHLSALDLDLASRLGVWIAHCPESNCNNHVGHARLDRFRADRVLLATDGMNSNMLGALRTAFLLHKGFGSNGEDALQRMNALLFANPSGYASKTLGRTIGCICEDGAADFAVFPYSSPTPVTAENGMAHVVYALSSSPRASWVYAHGKPALEDGRVVAIDEDEVYAAARECAARLWKDYFAT